MERHKNIKSDNWFNNTGLDIDTVKCLERLGDLKEAQEQGRQQKDLDRYGLYVIPWEQIQQY